MPDRDPRHADSRQGAVAPNDLSDLPIDEGYGDETVDEDEAIDILLAHIEAKEGAEGVEQFIDQLPASPN